jgi:alpha-glucosidase
MTLKLLRISTLLWIQAFAASAPALSQGWHHLGSADHLTRLSNGVELSAGRARVRVTAFREGVIRVRLAPDGNFPDDSSWAVVDTSAPPPVWLVDSPREVRVTAGRVVVRIRKQPLLIDFLDAAGKILLADETSRPMAWDGALVRVWKKMPPDENYYGLGDKAGPMNRRNRSFVMWNTDAFGWQESTDPLYKTIPFFMGLRNGTAYGLFFDNTYRSSFDFGKESENYFSFGSEGGALDYYFFAGPAPKTVLEEYTALVGRIPLPPLWSLGYQQSRWSYASEARVREVASEFREGKIPADVIYLDIDYQDGNRPFTVDRRQYPAFERMIRDLRAQGFHTVVITDPHLKKEPGYAPYDSGLKKDAFVRNPDGSVYVGTVWPGESVFPDFTLSRVREWWGSLYAPFAEMGIAGFWNDMNEPAVFKDPEKTMPLDVVHRLDDGTARDHRAIHNVFGMLNARATYEGLRKLQPDERPFVLTRAAFAGTARYAASWTGDNSSTWNHLAMSTPTLLSLGLSGYPLIGDDIGGFAGSPPADLLTRWIELGVFNPIYRNHTSKGTADQEPWVHGPEHEAVRRRFIELRYRLLPYIYTGIEETSRTGIPLMRPVFLEFPAASDFYGEDREFLFGRDLLVAPVVTEMTDAQEVRLPPGDWYDYWTAEKHAGGQTIRTKSALDQIPLFVRAGAILPQQPAVQFTGAKPEGPLELRVYPGPECAGSLYLDDGHTYAYQSGKLLHADYSCSFSAGRSITVTSRVEKSGFQPWWSSTEVTIFGVTSAPASVQFGGRVVQGWRYDGQAHAVTLTVPDSAQGWTLQLLW